MSCAREGGGGVAYEVLRSVEKEVILVDPVTSTAPSTSVDHTNEGSMNVDATDAAPQAVITENMVTDASDAVKVIKVIKKVEVSCLCHQHNPVCCTSKQPLPSHGSTKDQLVYCFSAARDGHKSSPGSHWIGDLTCGIIINHLTVHMYSIHAGLTSAISLLLSMVMIAFTFFVLPSPPHHVSVQPCRQGLSRYHRFSTMSSLDKAVSQKTNEAYGLSLF